MLKSEITGFLVTDTNEINVYNLDKCEEALDHIGPHWTKLDHFEPLWTELDQLAPNWTI